MKVKPEWGPNFLYIFIFKKVNVNATKKKGIKKKLSQRLLLAYTSAYFK